MDIATLKLLGTDAQVRHYGGRTWLSACPLPRCFALLCWQAPASVLCPPYLPGACPTPSFSGAQTNFPATTYSKALPALAAHSGEQVVAALKKDSALSLTRTSKHRGTRRIAAGQYEARLPPRPAPALAGPASTGAAAAADAAAGAAAAAASASAVLAAQVQQAQQAQLFLQQQYAAQQYGHLGQHQAALPVLPIVGEAPMALDGQDLFGLGGLGLSGDQEVLGQQGEAAWDVFG